MISPRSFIWHVAQYFLSCLLRTKSALHVAHFVVVTSFDRVLQLSQYLRHELAVTNSCLQLEQILFNSSGLFAGLFWQLSQSFRQIFDDVKSPLHFTQFLGVVAHLSWHLSQYLLARVIEKLLTTWTLPGPLLSPKMWLGRHRVSCYHVIRCNASSRHECVVCYLTTSTYR